MDGSGIVDAMLRGVMVSATLRALKGQRVFSQATLMEGVQVGGAGVVYDMAVRPAVKSVAPQIPLPNGK